MTREQELAAAAQAARDDKFREGAMVEEFTDKSRVIYWAPSLTGRRGIIEVARQDTLRQDNLWPKNSVRRPALGEKFVRLLNRDETISRRFSLDLDAWRPFSRSPF